MRTERWYARRAEPLSAADEDQLFRLIQEAAGLAPFEPAQLSRLLRRYPRASGQFAKDQIVAAYRRFCAEGRLDFDREILRRLQMKPVRTVSGVATVTVLTKPFPCPGECIFCPTDARMPKSYLADEPGAIRAEYHHFDPYETTASRLRALENIGHATDKVELLILGGTWSYYPRDYQEWFIQRCFDALNGVDSRALEEAQRRNETAARRNVGLAIETRPDYVDADEVRRLRRYGVTKVQLGAQSLDDRILDLNRRGHTVAQTRQAVRLLRAAGFKLHLHWMPNLLGATPASDQADYERLWSDPGLRPDELKIYPCALVREAALADWYEQGAYRPYSDDELIELLAACKLRTPRYVRLNRIIRDIPAGHMVAGSTASNLREVVQRRLAAQGQACQCIRCREVRDRGAAGPWRLASNTYATSAGDEHFLSFNTAGDRLGGFLRLLLPAAGATAETGLDELRGAAVVREVHVYGPVVRLGEAGQAADAGPGRAQHVGLGGRLLAEAEAIARRAGYGRLAVIAAVGTREYYRRHGFAVDGLYMLKPLASS
ncbi:MAG: tRNA uridine(34) 5-carboxymethylaminomethyl modification radical SAM/GNAT enzyme Elp3 [Anaerolineales bacterium]|nr:tRNA uridine(34) 5-carboxymethylaminomethyl modification radical SAM/GNAT enzyme Elp3 [Anaerolineales bacterium]